MASNDNDAINFAVVDQSLSSVRKVQEYVDIGISTTMDIAHDFVDNSKDVNDPKLSEVKEVMQEFIRLNRQLQCIINASDKVKQQAANGSDDINLVEIFDDALSAELCRDTKFDPKEHEKFTEMLERIDSVLESDVDVVAEQMDEDLAITSQDVNTRCPYTGQEMVDPVTNKHCRHNFDKEGILQFIKSRHRVRCPVPGCKNEKALDAADLIENRELKKIIAKMNAEKTANR